MAWTYTTKEIVSAWAKIAQADLLDQYSDWAEALIDDWQGTTYLGTTAYTDEKHSGDGSSVVFVDHPPIVSVSAITVSTGQVSSSEYEIFPYYIQLTTDPLTETSNALWRPNVWPEGVGNILISYVGGSETVPKKVELAATQMVSVIASVSERQGADLSLKYSRTTENLGDSETMTERLGLQATLRSIMRAYLGPKVQIR